MLHAEIEKVQEEIASTEGAIALAKSHLKALKRKEKLLVDTQKKLTIALGGFVDSENEGQNELTADLEVAASDEEITVSE